MRLYSFVLVILIVVPNEWLATDSRNTILNNFEEYYTLDTRESFAFHPFGTAVVELELAFILCLQIF